MTFGDQVLGAGDGVGISIERAFSFTAREETEVMRVDLGKTLLRNPDRDTNMQTGAGNGSH